MTFTLRFVRLKLFMYIDNHFKLQTIKFHSNVKSQIIKIHLNTCKTINYTYNVLSGSNFHYIKLSSLNLINMCINLDVYGINQDLSFLSHLAIPRGLHKRYIGSYIWNATVIFIGKLTQISWWDSTFTFRPFLFPVTHSLFL